MRRIKAIYLIPVFLVLLIGAGVASYYFLFKPRLELVDQARADWETARTALVTEAGANDVAYKKALNDQEIAARKIFEDYHKFHAIQLTMPAVYNMKELYAGKEKEGIYEWYRIMGEGRMIRELNRWVKSFHLPNAPTFSYSGTMPFELPPGAKTVSVDFGTMKFSVRGFRNLMNSLRRVTGYGYNPMILTLGDTATIQLNPDLPRTSPYHDPNNPSLTLSYSATAYFMTRGWDPMGADAAKKIAEYEQLVLDKPINKYKPQRTGWIMAPGETKECPPVLFFIKQPGMSEEEGKYKY